jgi:hypothetical protein
MKAPDIPCKDCLVFPICKNKLVYNKELIYSEFLKCSLIEKWIRKNDFYNFTKTIFTFFDIKYIGYNHDDIRKFKKVSRDHYQHSM